MYSLNCKGRLLSWENPIVMGILNLSPDSFYAGSRIYSDEMLVRQAEKMISEGASILDLGGSSSRPGAIEIPEDEEMKRVVPAIRLLSACFPEVIISVDAYRYNVAKAALDAGAAIINDIGAGDHLTLAALAVSERVPYICMHMRGTPVTMQEMTQYDDIGTEVLDFFIKRKAQYAALGLKDLIIDPGFGFAKNTAQNFRLLKEMKLLGMLELPVLVGLSRKATIYKTLNVKPEDSLNGSTVMHTLALAQGAKILRAHDVREAMETIRLWTSYTKA